MPSDKDLDTFNELRERMINREENAGRLMRQLFENTKLSTIRSLAKAALGTQGLLTEREMRCPTW